MYFFIIFLIYLVLCTFELQFRKYFRMANESDSRKRFHLTVFVMRVSVTAHKSVNQVGEMCFAAGTAETICLKMSAPSPPRAERSLTLRKLRHIFLLSFWLWSQCGDPRKLTEGGWRFPSDLFLFFISSSCDARLTRPKWRRRQRKPLHHLAWFVLFLRWESCRMNEMDFFLSRRNEIIVRALVSHERKWKSSLCSLFGGWGRFFSVSLTLLPSTTPLVARWKV